MAATSSMKTLACIAVVCMVLVASSMRTAEAAISCGTVTGMLSPCIPYARGRGAGPVPPPCCNGIRNLNGMARTTPDRQATCTCLKAAAGSIKGINFGVVGGIPGKCRVPVPYKISLSTDCSKVR